MPFINELVTDADIDYYGLPFEKGRPRYWTHDKSTRRYLWGGMSGNPAADDIQQGCFWLYTDNQLYYIIVHTGSVSSSYAGIPCRTVWEREIGRAHV